ncbi:Transcription factor IIIC, putative zinc-finger [Kalmanozyma brasiliensis GHG001]|uniref:Transcription factor IIIC, putative zinc-finger n=1 Tax=Kalmanozyma brasiliensis (strain GHG001) TaxID=1365824 RepID=UPI00286800AF|nr:Transcription factor IIIC, putative zinc-finger [Kalmanozyma brasiliensis GHG001]KAF6767485.1 Transcription factor IIIC, putative zinc-finger [Kalmanozyma brasiliensis GHG001]
MTVEARPSRNVPPSEDRERIRACSIALSSGSQLLGNLQWSALGQALVVTDDALIILSPLTGLHIDLAKQARVQDVEYHPDWKDGFPHSVAQINIKTLLDNEHSERSRVILESDHSAVDARFQSARWASASWSNPGMGPHGSCLILATTSELDLFVLGAPLNTWTGDWKLFHALDLGPAADLTQLDVPQSAQNDCAGKQVFSQPRALLRRKQLAKEVLSATFIDLDASAQNGDGETQHASPLIVAGTRSGHIVIWECAPVSGLCKFISATPVSDTGIEKLSATTDVRATGAEARARIAFQDGSSVRMCDLQVTGEEVSVLLSTATPVQSHHCQITAAHWHGHLFVYATIGRVHAHDARTGQTATLSLHTEADSKLDPYSPVISICDISNSSRSVKVVLQDLREYHISLQSAGTDVLPIYPTKLTGYPPLTEALQRKHDLYQAFLGYETESGSSLSAASIVGAVRTNDRVAFLGYDVSDTISYQLEIAKSGRIAPAAVLDEALQRASAGTVPYLLVRIILALLHTSQQPAAFRDQLLSAVKERWRTLISAHVDPSNGAQQRLLYLLVCRLDDLLSDKAPQMETLKKQYRASVLRSWIHRWRSDLSQRSSTDDENQRLLSRLTAAFNLLPDAAQHTTGVTPTDETCAACQSPLTLSWDDQRQDLGWTKCSRGHVWPRCSVSLATISDREVRVCSGCWAKARLPEGSEGAWQKELLEAAAECLYCGGLWIVR